MEVKIMAEEKQSQPIKTKEQSKFSEQLSKKSIDYPEPQPMQARPLGAQPIEPKPTPTKKTKEQTGAGMMELNEKEHWVYPRAVVRIVTYDGSTDYDFGKIDLSEFGGYRFTPSEHKIECEQNVTYFASLVHEAMQFVHDEYERYLKEEVQE
jgi:hypothetical protein